MDTTVTIPSLVNMGILKPKEYAKIHAYLKEQGLTMRKITD